MLKTFLFFFLWVTVLFAQIPLGYYDLAAGKSGADLKTALHEIISEHTVLLYGELWAAFEKTDRAADGSVWEMFSECIFELFADQCGIARTICDCYSREHSFPRSWYGGSDIVPMHTDLFHIFPIDQIINSQRGNFPYGEVGAINNIREGGKGKFGRPREGLGYNETSVFEPDDEYKGDIARTFFYMVTRYENILEDWYEFEGARRMLNGTAYPAFREWALEMLVRWHLNDPVSQKEIDRNNAIYKLQNNRNPFIDNPDFVLQIWRNTPPNTSVVRQFSNKKETISVGIQNQTLRINTSLREDGRIYCINGKLLKNFNGSSVDLSTFSRGVYILKLGRNNLKFTLD